MPPGRGFLGAPLAAQELLKNGWLGTLGIYKKLYIYYGLKVRREESQP